jgi:hypothetical protein
MKSIKSIGGIFLLLFSAFFLITCSGGGGGGGSDNGGSDSSAYNQSDLAATWNIQKLEAGSTNEWGRYTVTIDATGTLSFTSCLDSAGSTACPAGQIVWTINSTNGVITESGPGGNSTAHYSMATNKNFIAGTSTGSAQIFVAQKKAAGTTYSGTEVRNLSFVYHALWAGGTNGWVYGAGTTDASGITTISNHTTAWGNTSLENELEGTLSVDAQGNVTLAGNSYIQGFMSNDKKSIVVTDNTGSSVAVYIIQITGNSFTVGPAQSHTSYVHMLGCGAADGWVHYTVTFDSSGGMTFTNWVTNNVLLVAPDTAYTGNIIDTSGTFTITGNPTYHGQISHNRNFVVGTQTRGTGPNSVYMLSVSMN